MKYLFALSFILLIAVTSYAQDTIWWKPGLKLTLSDFQIKAKANEHTGFSSVGITYRVNANGDKVNTHVASYFLPLKSWIGDDKMLEHEQVHFDIAELFARKLKIAFAAQELSAASAGREYKSVFNRLKKEKQEMTRLYDEDTQQAKNFDQQKVWSNKVRRELVGLEQYANK